MAADNLINTIVIFYLVCIKYSETNRLVLFSRDRKELGHIRGTGQMTFSLILQLCQMDAVLTHVAGE